MAPVADLRKATSADLPGLAETLAIAFFDDPVVRYWVPADNRRLEISRRAFALELEETWLPQNETYTAGDLAAVCTWMPPGTQDVVIEGFDERAGAAMAEYAERGFMIQGLMDESHPTEPHYYLPMIGTRPEHRGQGLGSALLASMTARLDSEGAAAYLEATSERNRALYLRHGFADIGKISLPDGPSMTRMWREPQS